MVMVTLVSALLCGLTTLKFSIQRLHDIEIPGWVVLFWIIPGLQVLSFPFLCCIAGTLGSNRFGPQSSDNK
jgi:uncharacterized membrane protein YhaH (DUF805 family)